MVRPEMHYQTPAAPLGHHPALRKSRLVLRSSLIRNLDSVNINYNANIISILLANIFVLYW